jgi:phosphoglycolate phosphatase-like HAD superfamily hydrolase
MVFPGGLLTGCSAGLVNVPRIKGSHNAVLSGVHAGEAAFAALQQGRAHDRLEGYEAAVREGSPEMEGASATLRALREQGLPLLLSTNKMERFARIILEQKGWHDLFDHVVGGDTFVEAKPNPCMLTCFAHNLPDQNLAALLFVGDSEVDRATALAAGTQFALLAQEGRDALATSPFTISRLDLLVDLTRRNAP